MNIQVSIKVKELATLHRFLKQRGIDPGSVNARPVKWAFTQTYNALLRKGMQEFESADEALEYLKASGLSLGQMAKRQYHKEIVQEISSDDIRLENEAKYVYPVNTLNKKPTIQDLIQIKGQAVIVGLRELQQTPEFRTLTNEEQDQAIQAWIERTIKQEGK